MIKLYKKSTKEFLGRITEEQLQFLQNRLEEESLHDRDYFLRKETVDCFEESGADAKLVEMLRAAMKPESGLEIEWERESS